jgi:hypothetical protein
MIGGTVGEVGASKNPAFAVGDPVVGMGGWQLYQRVAAAELGGLRKVDTNRIPLSAYLGAVGMPGVTVWYGLNRIIEPKAGKTVVVSAASGRPASQGARAVGIAGGPDKCRYVTQELGFDACIDYKQHPDPKSLSQALKEARPDGIDGHFENVGGMILDAVLQHSNSFARVALCGMISRYGHPIPITQTQHILMNRMRLEAFVITGHMEVWPDALKELGTLVATGKLTYRETCPRAWRPRLRPWACPRAGTSASSSSSSSKVVPLSTRLGIYRSTAAMPVLRFSCIIKLAMTKTDAPGFEVLAQDYRREAKLCRQKAAVTAGSQKDAWLRLSAEWIRLAKEADAMWWPAPSAQL